MYNGAGLVKIKKQMVLLENQKSVRIARRISEPIASELVPIVRKFHLLKRVRKSDEELVS